MNFRDEPGYFSDSYLRRISSSEPTWWLLRMVCFVLTFGRDGIFPLRKARQLDHIVYCRLWHEIPLWDVMPLSAETHRIVTKLRDQGLRPLVTLAMRVIAVLWLLLDAMIGAALLGKFWLVLNIAHAIGLFALRVI